MRRYLPLICCTVWLAGLPVVHAADRVDGNRFAHLDEPIDPYWVSRTTARLTTPQWVGESGVDAVAILSIDDMRDIRKYEQFLRPLIDRIKRYQGRSGFSILTNNVDPYDPQLAAWMAEGGSIEVHTLTHPCPLLQRHNLFEAKRSYDGCIDLLSRIPGPGPVAYRMPCCDSMNSVSPRFFDLIFNRTTPNGRFLQIDSSVFLVLDEGDPDLPRKLVLEPDGRSRFRKYIPHDRWMANLIYNYPYPYVIGGLCLEFPCIMPSDWDAQYLHGVKNPRTVHDWSLGLKAITQKQGVFTLVFHPHGWIEAQQVAMLVDYAEKELAGRVRFLSFQEALDRIRTNLLKGESLRRPDGGDNGVRIIDVNNDGFMDVIIANARLKVTRVWDRRTGSWSEKTFPFELVRYVPGTGYEQVFTAFGTVGSQAAAAVLRVGHDGIRCWVWDDNTGWSEVEGACVGLSGLAKEGSGSDPGIRLRDVDGDGSCELICGRAGDGRVFRWDASAQRWERAGYRLPAQVAVVDDRGLPAGAYFRDLDHDGTLDIVFSSPWACGVFVFDRFAPGWRTVFYEKRATAMGPGRLPPFVRLDGSSNGAWFHEGFIFLQNEDTGAIEKNHVLRYSVDELLRSAE